MNNIVLTTSIGCLFVASPAITVPAQADPSPEHASVKTTVDSANGFSVDLYHQLAKENEGKNLFFSPYSISTALTVALEGARGQTMQEMGQVLRFPKAAANDGDEAQGIPWKTSAMHSGFGGLEARFNRKEKPYELAVANALWGEQTMPFRPEFVKMIGRAYSTGGIIPMDFIGNPTGSCEQINGWVEDKTNKRIKDLIPKPEIDSSTRLVLTNAIYFKGEWASKFDKANTSLRDFTRADGSKVKTLVMVDELPIRFGYDMVEERSYISFAELPYKNDELSMVLISGGPSTPLDVIEKHLSMASISKWMGKLQDLSEGIPVMLPKFKMESKYKLHDTLKTMGMPTAFSPGKADFTGLNESAGKDLYISAVLHKGFIEVSEEGTEAAAATAVIIKKESRGPMFDGTRPFIYLIRDKHTGAILFMGRMMDPTAK